MSGNPPRYDPLLNTQYILKYRKPVPCSDLIRWNKWFGRSRRHVRRTYIGEIYVSTVFLGLDHRHTGEGDPILFETMVFSGRDIQLRCSSWREALNQHWEVVRSIKAKQG